MTTPQSQSVEAKFFDSHSNPCGETCKLMRINDDGTQSIATVEDIKMFVHSHTQAAVEEKTRKERARALKKIDRMQENSRPNQQTPFGNGYHTALVDAYNTIR